MTSVTYTALEGIPEIHPRCDLASVIESALRTNEMVLAPYDILVVAQKMVSKSEGRAVDLRRVQPSAEARRIAAVTGKDPRLVEVVLKESVEVVRAAPNVLIVRHRLGFVMANAGVDRSNVPQLSQCETVLLLPVDPDGSAAALRSGLQRNGMAPLGIIISDSFGRPWRNGVVNVAIGAAGIPSLIDCRGVCDREQRRLEMTEIALADAVAAGAGLAMGEAAEGTPVVLVRGLSWSAPEVEASTLLRPVSQDLFR